MTAKNVSIYALYLLVPNFTTKTNNPSEIQNKILIPDFINRITFIPPNNSRNITFLSNLGCFDIQYPHRSRFKRECLSNFVEKNGGLQKNFRGRWGGGWWGVWHRNKVCKLFGMVDFSSNE